MAKLVAPLAGAWIEIGVPERLMSAAEQSLPSRERGLKFASAVFVIALETVAPLEGAWIEIPGVFPGRRTIKVAPLAGAWIEINGVS